MLIMNQCSPPPSPTLAVTYLHNSQGMAHSILSSHAVYLTPKGLSKVCIASYLMKNCSGYKFSHFALLSQSPCQPSHFMPYV